MSESFKLIKMKIIRIKYKLAGNPKFFNGLGVYMRHSTSSSVIDRWDLTTVIKEDGESLPDIGLISESIQFETVKIINYL